MFPYEDAEILPGLDDYHLIFHYEKVHYKKIHFVTIILQKYSRMRVKPKESEGGFKCAGVIPQRDFEYPE